MILSKEIAEQELSIAERVPTMNKEKAYILGLLHDIGRRVGASPYQYIF